MRYYCKHCESEWNLGERILQPIKFCPLCGVDPSWLSIVPYHETPKQYEKRTGKELLRQLPGVLRARDFHLYLEGGKRHSRRLMDLWLQGGRAVLGHKPPKVINELKNAAERGLFTPLPHPLERRFIKALGEFFPGKAFRLYQDEASLYRALNEAGFAEAMPFLDPAFPADNEDEKREGSLWRPFLEPVAANGTPILVPVLPWSLGGGGDPLRRWYWKKVWTLPFHPEN